MPVKLLRHKGARLIGADSFTIFKPEMIAQKNFIKTIPQQVTNDFLKGTILYTENNFKEYGEVKAYLHKFNSLEAEMHVDWAIEYWAGKRDACCTESIAKCTNCEYRQKCGLL